MLNVTGTNKNYNRVTNCNITRRNLSYSLYDAFFYSLMVGLGETYLPAFILAEGFSALAGGLIATLPLIIGGFLQTIAPLLAYKVGSLKKFVLLAATTQAVSLIALAIAGFYYKPGIIFFFVTASIYWAGGMATSQAWNAWINYLVPNPIRTHFFSRRNMFSYIAIFIALFTGGTLLHFKQIFDVKLVFVALFSLAGLFRLISIFWLSKHSPPPEGASLHVISLKEVINTISGSSYGKLFVFVFFFVSGVYVSAGFFNPFMLKELGFSYFDYMLILAASFTSRIIMLTRAHSIIKKFSHRRVLLASTLLIVPTPFLWCLSQNFYWLVFLQIMTGVTWGLYELVLFLILFNDLPINERTSVLAVFNLMQNFAVFMGSLIGGTIFWYMESYNLAYELTFTVSSLIRLLAFLTFPGILFTAARIRTLIHLRPVGVRPIGGLLTLPLFVRPRQRDK